MAGNKRWTIKEIDYLTKNYNGGSIDTIAKYLQRSKASIHKKASDLGISFSFDERTEVMKMLLSIKEDIADLRIIITRERKFVSEFDDIIKENATKLTDKAISEIIGTTPASVRNRRLTLGLDKPTGGRGFGQYLNLMNAKHKEIKEMKEKGFTHKKISETLFPKTGIKHYHIASYVYNKGFSNPKKITFSREVVNEIIKRYPLETAKEISMRLKIPFYSLRVKINELIKSGALKGKYKK